MVAPRRVLFSRNRDLLLSILTYHQTLKRRHWDHLNTIHQLLHHILYETDSNTTQIHLVNNPSLLPSSTLTTATRTCIHPIWTRKTLLNTCCNHITSLLVLHHPRAIVPITLADVSNINPFIRKKPVQVIQNILQITAI